VTDGLMNGQTDRHAMAKMHWKQ